VGWRILRKFLNTIRTVWKNMEETKKNEGEKDKNTVTEAVEIGIEVAVTVIGARGDIHGAEAGSTESDESEGEGTSAGVKPPLTGLDSSDSVEALQGIPRKLKCEVGIKTARKSIGGRFGPLLRVVSVLEGLFNNKKLKITLGFI
jgi:hypothetical protein